MGQEETEMKKHAEAITGSTGLLCLLGAPVKHSISPEMHNEAFRLLDLDYRYLAFETKQEDLKKAVDGLRTFGALGWNLTMPLKTAMVPLCDELTLNAELCGAVNTVVNRDGKLVGTTTDGLGWVLSARAEGHEIKGKHLTLLGAGGAGSSVLAECAVEGAAVIDVFKRKNETWDAVAAFVRNTAEKTDCSVRIHDMADLDDLKACIMESDILLNGTPVGMPGNPGCLIPDESFFHPGLVVSDMIYEPRETELLKMARRAGLQTFNGMYMLLYQGAAAFSFWTGQEMPVEAVRKKYFS